MFNLFAEKLLLEFVDIFNEITLLMSLESTKLYFCYDALMHDNETGLELVFGVLKLFSLPKLEILDGID